MTEYDDDGLNPTSTTYQSLDCAVHSLRWVMQVLIVGQTDQNRIQASCLYYIILIMRKLENRVGTFYTGLRQIPYLVGKQRERKMAHTELVLRERRTIEDMLNARMSVDRIAAKIGRHRSTVFRDIKRNRFVDDELPKLNGYYGMNAQRTAVTRRARRRNLVRFVDLRKHVITQLESGWSPEQIAGRLQYDGQSLRVSHETIYAYVYGPDGQSEELARHLPHRRKKRQPRRRRTPRGLVFPPDWSIHERPDYVKTRKTFGEWEGNLMIFERAQGKANVASLVERKTRFAVLFRNNDRSTTLLMNKLMSAMEPLPQPARKSITFDRGIEFRNSSQGSERRHGSAIRRRRGKRV